MITVQGYDGNPVDQRSIESMGDRFLKVLNRLAFSGVYPTGGDTLDWSNAGGTPAAPNAVPAGATNPAGPVYANVATQGSSAGLSVAGGSYTLIPGATLQTWKVIIFDHTGAEIGAGAYPATVTADIVEVDSRWER